jgi:hypothetical protein
MSPTQCRSARRCNQITCATCCWRHANHVTRRFLKDWSEPFCAITLALIDPSQEGYRRARVEIRNRLDYLRRKSPVWRSFGLHLYLCADGSFRGIAALGGMGPQEVVGGLARRWPMTLRPISVSDLRVEIYRAARVVSTVGPHQGRYWPRRLSISPKRSLARSRLVPQPNINRHIHEPMPVVF